MASSSDDRSFSVEEIRTATANGHLAALAERLARSRDYVRLVALFEGIAELPVPLGLLTDAVKRTADALRRPVPGRRPAGDENADRNDDKRTVRLLAGESLLACAPRRPLTMGDRDALGAAASILAEAGDLHRAATTFDLADNLAAAAELWGRLGDLEAMEARLARDEERRRSDRATVGALRDLEALLAGGERLAALEIARCIPEGSGESRRALEIVRDLEGRLLRSRSVTLLPADGQPIRVASTPAVFGRDPRAEIPLRDPGVSRRHAVLSIIEDQGYTVTDAGSRQGTFLGGARVTEPVLLAGDAELQLGPSCRLSIRQPAPERAIVRGTSALDSGVLVLVGRGRLPLGDLIPQATGAWIEFEAPTVSLMHPPELPVRIRGTLASPRIDLLRGDRLEIGQIGSSLFLEVP